MDILKFAIEMELEGEKYYREQAESHHENSLDKVFISLANDESNHAKILKNKSKGLHYQFNTSIRSTTQNIFEGLGDFKIAIKSNPDQVDVYRMTLEKERQSIELYKKLRSESEDDKDLFEFLVSQEEQHYKILEEIIKMVNRPNEWVESAEFGLREEY